MATPIERMKVLAERIDSLLETMRDLRRENAELSHNESNLIDQIADLEADLEKACLECKQAEETAEALRAGVAELEALVAHFI